MYRLATRSSFSYRPTQYGVANSKASVKQSRYISNKNSEMRAKELEFQKDKFEFQQFEVKPLPIKTPKVLVGLDNIGLTRFTNKVYSRMGAGVTISMALAGGLATTFDPMAMEYALGCLGVGIVSSFGSIFALNMYKPTYKEDTIDGESVIYSENPTGREIAFWTLPVGMGIMITPMMNIMLEIDPMIPVAATMTAAVIFGGAVFASKRIKDSTMLQWKAPLIVGLGGLICMQLAGLGASFFMGSNSFSNIVHSVDVYGGIGLFTLMSIYDSYKARKMYLKGKPDHIKCATKIYLDMMNLIIRIMEAFARAKKQ